MPRLIMHKYQPDEINIKHLKLLQKNQADMITGEIAIEEASMKIPIFVISSTRRYNQFKAGMAGWVSDDMVTIERLRRFIDHFAKHKIPMKLEHGNNCSTIDLAKELSYDEALLFLDHSIWTDCEKLR